MTLRSNWIRTFLILLIATGFQNISAQKAAPKYEFRAVWVATVNNIDWPSKPGLPVETLKKEVTDLLDMHLKNGMNAIILQVRPAADAFYPSPLEPWSRYLTGSPGKAPDPFWDPLQFWIDECHKRNMELHAWLNPYRVAQNSREPLAANHIAFKHPEWVVNYGGKLYFDPGIPETRHFVTQVVCDLVRRYDLDAIHFDDYFYPYPLREDFPDNRSFAQYNRAFSPDQKAHWRRENVDILIKMLNDSIKSIKPWVKFGISPFGVWRNKKEDPEGSDTNAGITNYDHLYADILKWLREGWIDYVTPQIYWETGHPAADFETLCHWWNRYAYGKGLYIGHAVYKLEPSGSSAAWRLSGQLPRQVEILRKYPNISGSAFYSSKHFKRNLLGFQDSLSQRLYRTTALTPPMPWLDNQPPATPVKIKTSGRRVQWKPAETHADEPLRFLIYLNEAGKPFSPDDPQFIVQHTRLHAVEFNRKSGKRKKYEIRISALDRLNNESPLSDPVILKL